MNILEVQFDKDKFRQEVEEIFDPTPVLGSINSLMELKYPEALQPPMLWDTFARLQKLISIICAAVEVTKQKFINTSGVAGAKFDKELALKTAVQLLDDCIILRGWVGSVIERYDTPILNWMISAYIAGKPKDWLDEAKAILNANK